MPDRSERKDNDKQEKSSKRGDTRRALLDAALLLVERTGSFGATSLRQITRKAGVVPTAFYRHFKDMDTLGLILVDESFRTLRQMMREIRKQKLPTQQIIRTSVENYFSYVRQYHQHFLFVAKERYTGNPVLRSAIRQEIRLFTSELATDLSRLLPLDKVSAEDLQVMAALIVNTLVSATQQMMELTEQAHTETEQEELIQATDKQLRIIALGVAAWKS
jgi:AcrR family transcriptional regulator